MKTTSSFVASGRMYVRARAWERRFEQYATEAESVGCAREAAKLRAIGNRAMVVAERLAQIGGAL